MAKRKTKKKASKKISQKKSKKVSKKSSSKEPKLKGIRGWLLVFYIGIVVSLLAHVLIFLGEADAFTEELITGTTLFPVDWTVLVTSGITAGLIIFLLYLGHERNSAFVSVGIFLLWVSFLFTIILEFNRPSGTGVIGELLGAIVWTCYLKRSKRVKNTFTK